MLRQHPPPPYPSIGSQVKMTEAAPSLDTWWSIVPPQILHLKHGWLQETSSQWPLMASLPRPSTMWGWGERMLLVAVSPVQPCKQRLMVSWLRQVFPGAYTDSRTLQATGEIVVFWNDNCQQSISFSNLVGSSNWTCCALYYRQFLLLLQMKWRIWSILLET